MFVDEILICIFLNGKGNYFFLSYLLLRLTVQIVNFYIKKGYF